MVLPVPDSALPWAKRGQRLAHKKTNNSQNKATLGALSEQGDTRSAVTRYDTITTPTGRPSDNNEDERRWFLAAGALQSKLKERGKLGTVTGPSLTSAPTDGDKVCAGSIDTLASESQAAPRERYALAHCSLFTASGPPFTACPSLASSLSRLSSVPFFATPQRCLSVPPPPFLQTTTLQETEGQTSAPTPAPPCATARGGACGRGVVTRRRARAC